MIHLKNLLKEYVKYAVKGAPRRFVKMAEEYGGNAFRIKLVGRDDDNPTFNDIKEVLDYDRYFGINSRYANGKYIYVVSDDLRKSAKRAFFDIAIYEIKKLPVAEDGTMPVLDIKEKLQIGQSKMIMQSDFEKLYPTSTWMSRIKDAFRSASLEAPSDSADPITKNTNISTDDKSNKGTGDNTEKPKTNNNIDNKSANNVVLNNDETAEIDGIKISKKDLTDNISKIKTDQIYLKQFQLLMNQAITKLVTANPTMETSNDYKNNLLPFVNAKSKYGQTFGPATQSALRSMNKAYLKFSGKTKEEIAAYNDDVLLEITSGLLNTMFEKGLKESTIKLSSILKEILLEQGGFDFSDNDEIAVIKTQTVKTSKDSLKTQTKLDTKKDDTKKDDVKKLDAKKDDAKKETPKSSGSNKLVRMANGYITCTNTIAQLTSNEFQKKYSGSDLFGRIMPDIGTKKLLYGKNVKVRKGIDKLPLSGMQSAFKNIWRGYEEIPHLVALKGDVDPVSWYIRDVKVGSILPLTIGSIKSKINKLGTTEKDIEIESYAWVITSDKKGCWVPTTWIAIV